MMKMKNKSNLDEMQEKKLLQIEHNTCWIAFWGLFAAIYIQIAMGNGGIRTIGGESAVLLVMCLYLVISCVKNGLWDRTLQPNFKTNLAISLITGLVFGLFWALLSYRNYHDLVSSLATGALLFLSIGVSALVLLSLLTAIYHCRREKLEDTGDEDENEPNP